VAPSRGCTQSKGETLDLLLATHFPNSVVIERKRAPAACRAKRLDWHVAARVVTCGRVVWAIDSFAPYKSPGMDGIFPALLQEGQGVFIPYLVKIFCACWVTSYVPAIWHHVKVAFIPKPGTDSCGIPMDFRPISLTLFLLKPTERLVDGFLRD